MLKNKKRLICTAILGVICISLYFDKKQSSTEIVIMGGKHIKEFCVENDKEVDNQEEYYSLERFFRPSSSKIINDRIEKSLYEMYGNKPNEVKIDDNMLKTPEDTIINYFSVLREAANPLYNTNTGCGTIGDAKGPYPVAYNFLTDGYRKKMDYNKYVKSFENKLHINLVKLNKAPGDKNNPNDIKYFVEIEVIEGSKENKGLFAYYYGYIHLEKLGDTYKIKDMVYNDENYLCAPYHGWSYDAKSFLEIEYGEWCSLIDSDIKIEEDGYEKKAYFKDKNNNEYYVLFYQLTNGVDLKIADYKKDKNGVWKVIYIEPEKCLDKNKVKN
ncbi:hypothetical protein [Romboutsia lituseburensis]|uniref:hypothetical protein n=1 Tax=Romboutsia lituseburensis TaxID=1537 RepID=UPI00215B27E4|nr:hypothetical protein [Romboutsia lituseburensis]MCR8744789.1 hypothetical protein [Romboutsia lituseburensis]